MSPAAVPARAHVPGDGPTRNEGEGPDLRAAFAGRRFRLLPAEGARFAAPAEVSFDLWDHGAEILARQHGTAAAEAEIARLARWAGERGARLRLGSPLGPERAPVARL